MGNIVEERRIGEFEIRDTFIWEQPEMVKAFLADFLIVEATMKFERRAILYIAYHELFDPVPEGRDPLYYEMIFREEMVSEGRMRKVFDQLVKRTWPRKK